MQACSYFYYLEENKNNYELKISVDLTKAFSFTDNVSRGKIIKLFFSQENLHNLEEKQRIGHTEWNIDSASRMITSYGKKENLKFKISQLIQKPLQIATIEVWKNVEFDIKSYGKNSTFSFKSVV